jgi:Kef-type K+ transport system membrane component KefB
MKLLNAAVKEVFSKKYLIGLGFVLALAATPMVQAAGSGNDYAEKVAITFLWIAVILIVAKLAGLVTKFGQPAVLGELLIGIVLGNLALLGVTWFEPIKSNEIIAFLSELGVVILLFQIGLESNVKEMREVGVRAFLVSIIGVIIPFVLGAYIVGPWLLPGLSSAAYLFLGATLTATSVGITARIFKDLKKLKTPESRMVIGAAVIDDILGLVLLAVVSAFAVIGSVSFGLVSSIIVKALLFLIASIVIGQLIAPRLGKMLAALQTKVGMKLTLAIGFCLILSYAAHAIGLVPIVGAFAAGLVLDSVHFRYFRDPKVIYEIKQVVANIDKRTHKKLDQVVDFHAKRHIEDLIEPIGIFLVPIFFVVTGMSVELATLFDLRIILIALLITVAAILGKLVSGLAAGKANKLIVGLGMVPRGEVGLIFAVIGKGLGVVSDELFSVIIIMVILTTLVVPPFLAGLLRKQED